MKTIFSQQFPFLSEADIDQLMTIGTDCNYKNKMPIIRMGKKTTDIYFILEGMARGYFIAKSGEERTLFIRPTHTFFTAPELLKNDNIPKFTFEAIGEVTLFKIPFTTFEQLSYTSIPFARLYIEALKENVLTLISRIEMLAGKTPEERYEILLEQYPQIYQKAAHKYIANYLGITPTSFSRIIKRKKRT